jgi:hypothetical protein
VQKCRVWIDERRRSAFLGVRRILGGGGGKQGKQGRQGRLAGGALLGATAPPGCVAGECE